MERAINLAKQAKGEIPVGALIIKDGEVIAETFNQKEILNDVTAHAEILAISKACKKLKSWRLEDCDIYVTLEPCPMCAGAILNARIKNVYFGAYDKTSKTNLLNQIMQDDRLNHKTTPIGGILQTECSNLLTSFFKSKRLNSNIASEE